MIAYFDTSAIIPLIIEEPASKSCERIWNDAARVLSVRLMYAEARAALAMANRLERISKKQLSTAVDLLDGFVAEVDRIEVTENLVRGAGTLAQEHSLRGYDAIHLAAVQTIADDETVFVSGDQQLIRAANRIGLATNSPM